MIKYEDKKNKGIYIAMVSEEEHGSKLFSMMVEYMEGNVNLLMKNILLECI